MGAGSDDGGKLGPVLRTFWMYQLYPKVRRQNKCVNSYMCTSTSFRGISENEDRSLKNHVRWRTTDRKVKFPVSGFKIHSRSFSLAK